MSQAVQSTPATLTVVEDIRNPDPALAYEAQWRLNQGFRYHDATKDAVCIEETTVLLSQANNCFLQAFRQVLGLIEHPFNPKASKEARRTFYAMKMAFEERFGKNQLPPPIFKRACACNLVKNAA